MLVQGQDLSVLQIWFRICLKIFQIFNWRSQRLIPTYYGTGKTNIQFRFNFDYNGIFYILDLALELYEDLSIASRIGLKQEERKESQLNFWQIISTLRSSKVKSTFIQLPWNFRGNVSEQKTSLCISDALKKLKKFIVERFVQIFFHTCNQTYTSFFYFSIGVSS